MSETTTRIWEPPFTDPIDIHKQACFNELAQDLGMELVTAYHMPLVATSDFAGCYYINAKSGRLVAWMIFETPQKC